MSASAKAAQLTWIYRVLHRMLPEKQEYFTVEISRDEVRLLTKKNGKGIDIIMKEMLTWRQVIGQQWFLTKFCFKHSAGIYGVSSV